MANKSPQKPKNSDGRGQYRIDCDDCDYSPLATGWIAAELVAEEHEMMTSHDVDFSENR